MVMFDSLNRHMLPPYGANWVHAPNFSRLARRSVTFDHCYAGSLPCVPARRELHTGRYNFLHRGWGPLEPFDDSMPELLKTNGVYSHLATDHMHYFEDGGATYHTRYSTWELFRGQQGDPWKGCVADPHIPENVRRAVGNPWWRQDWINRKYMQTESEHPQTRTFDAGLEFIRTNHGQDNWFLQIEAFDPHEPFFTHKQYKDLYPHDYGGPHIDHPDYGRVREPADQAGHARYEYAALLSMCDHSLGRVLDAMDELSLWDDTMLIVNTDHGYLLGDHGWWGKMYSPWYEELVHLPLFMWDPRSDVADQRRSSLVQTIDLAPTVLDFFGIERPPDMQGVSLTGVIATDAPVRAAGLFGLFGAYVNVTDGRYVYMRAQESGRYDVYNYTLMPTRMRSRFTPAELARAELTGPFTFTKGAGTLKVPFQPPNWVEQSGTLLFDLHDDPHQRHPIADPAIERRMITLLHELMHANDAPPEQYERLGIPADESALAEEIDTCLRAGEGIRRAEELAAGASRSERVADIIAALQPAADARYRQLLLPIRRLLADPGAGDVLRRHLPALADAEILTIDANASLVDFVAGLDGAISIDQLRDIIDDLAESERRHVDSGSR